ncbi:hypothetical protein KI387_043727, partial [Taxus chinensis]
TSSAARGIGMVKIVPICKSIPPVPTNDEIQDGLCFENLDANVGILEVPDSRLKNNQVLSTSFSGPISPIYRAEQAQKSVLKIIDNSHINKSDGESFTEIDFESETRSSCYHHARISFDFPSSSSDGDVNSFKKRSGDSEYERSSLNQEILEVISEDPSKDTGKYYHKAPLGEKPKCIQNLRENGNVVTISSKSHIFFRGLDHVDSLDLHQANIRLTYVINWFVNALSKNFHPPCENLYHLVKIYGPKVKYNRGHGISFNLYDWK